MRVAIIGAGVSGIAYAGVMQRFGHDCVLFEKRDEPGGIWALAYPGVRLQNSREQYAFTDFPWPQQPDQHPTAQQIKSYLKAAIEHWQLKVRLAHEVTQVAQTDDGWTLRLEHKGVVSNEQFDYVVVSIGQYAEGKNRPEFPGEGHFAGRIVTEREVDALEVFRDQRVAVVGFGKSAVDMATFAAASARSVAHVFRTPRWLVPFRILGVHFTYPFFPRASTVLMPSWVHPGRFEAALHRYAAPLVGAFWKTIGWVVKRHMQRHARTPEAAQRLATITPRHDFAADLRSATAMAPEPYFGMVASGRIEPHHAGVKGFDRDGLELDNGETLAADIVVLSVGSGAPVFPFLPDRYRQLLESEHDGVQLYRHIVHPHIPRLAFAGYNHGFMHIPSAELGAVWLCASLRGDIQLPDQATQERSIETIRSWKRAHVHFEPSRSCAVSTRFQQHIDALLLDLGLPRFRKLPNVVAEVFQRYGAADYAGLIDSYLTRDCTEVREVQSFNA